MNSMLRKRLFDHFVKVEKGRHFVSFWASKIFERAGIKRLFGVNLVAALLVTSVLTPELTALANHQSLIAAVQETDIEADPTTKTTFDLPLANFRISQGYRFWHPGIDMTAPLGTPIYAIDDGIVEYIESSYFGYGKHVVIAHEHNYKSLYGHMSEIKTFVGRKVSRGELIGRVGSTGWSTGNHLHFEIYYNGASINPLEVLPIERDTIVYDPVYTQTATASASVATQPSADPTQAVQSVAPSPSTTTLVPGTAPDPATTYYGATQILSTPTRVILQ